MEVDVLFLSHAYCKYHSNYRYFSGVVGNFKKLKGLVKPLPIFSAFYPPIPIEKSEIDFFLRKKREELKYKHHSHPWKVEFKMSLYRFLLPRIGMYVKRLIEDYNPKVLVVWNGLKYPLFIVRQLAMQYNIPVIYLENGPLPDTIQADLKGVNFLNSVPRDKSFYEKNFFEGELPQNLIPRKPAICRKFKNVKKIDVSSLKYVFIPFQVWSDTQIIYFSPWIKSMEQLFWLFVDIAKEFPDLHFIFKEHPSERFADYSKLHRIADKFPNLHFASNSTQELIEKAEVVVTINSSVGVEALLWHKKVIVLGQAFYDIDGIAKRAWSFSELLEHIKNLDNWEVDTVLVDNFLRYLYNYYLLKPKNDVEIFAENFEERLINFIEEGSF